MTLLSRIARALTPFRDWPPCGALSESMAHPHPDFGEVMGPLTASDLGRMGRAAQLRTLAERKAATTAALRAERDAGWPAGGEAA